MANEILKLVEASKLRIPAARNEPDGTLYLLIG